MPSFDPSRILFEDEWLIAVNKPVGVPAQAARAEEDDSLSARLHHYLNENGETPYIGTHQHLDRDTSGVLVFAKKKEANRSLSEQWQQRKVVRHYRALVRGWRGSKRRLHTSLRRERGRMRPSQVGGRAAISYVEPIECRHGYADLAIRVETGHTHTIRAQLAAEEAPIVGDALYEGESAPRLMLHAHRLQLIHPLKKETMHFEAPVPKAFSRKLRSDETQSLAEEIVSESVFLEKLHQAAEARWFLIHSDLHPKPTSCFRWVDGWGDDLPGCAIDVYGDVNCDTRRDFAVIHLYDSLPGELEQRLAELVGTFGFEGLYFKRRPKKASDVDTLDDAVAPAKPCFGTPAPERFLVQEFGIPFEVSLSQGLSTGLFLDQRENRRRVRAHRPETLLNLFAYTGTFSTAAAAGGTSETMSIDRSGRALSVARRNLQRVAESMQGHSLVGDDVFAALKRLNRRGQRFDLVVVDPPTYATSRRTRWKSGSQWTDLSAACFSVTAPGGSVFASSNDRRMSEKQFRQFLYRGARLSGRTLRQIKDLPLPQDFRAGQAGVGQLKAAWLEVE